MIYHHNRFVFKKTTTAPQREEALASLRNQGASIDAVVRYVVGKDVGGEFEYGAVFVLKDLDGYWEYLTAPSHAHTDRIGLPLLESFVSYDTTDEDDPDIAQKIAALHTRRYTADPALRRLVAALPSYTGSSAPR
ncbi:stress responsive protein [Streptomyces spiroverticillatus]|uniref:Stress responsive protein n=1 Tax=Streptomyces finlayi TaxID=67296 RepID=A0A918X3G7_9ACTN|nr:Dabb family protein [Streptomyces finlayi]GHA27477.1 stress responsive protein [Streptomyces spiroverticillatus]GHD08592.1 stress responsive protein [Streptomyces finlayi]